jgi:hypothetical protein
MRRLTASPPTGYFGQTACSEAGVGPGCRLFPAGGPDNYAAPCPLPPGAQVVARQDAHTDLVHLFATNRAAPRALRSTLKAVAHGEPIWVSWPKKSSGVGERPHRRCHPRDRTATHLPWVDIKVCAWMRSGRLWKLVVRKSARPGAGPQPRTAKSGARRAK